REANVRAIAAGSAKPTTAITAAPSTSELARFQGRSRDGAVSVVGMGPTTGVTRPDAALAASPSSTATSTPGIRGETRRKPRTTTTVRAPRPIATQLYAAGSLTARQAAAHTPSPAEPRPSSAGTC